MTNSKYANLYEHVLGIVDERGGKCPSMVLFNVLRNTKRSEVYSAIRVLEGLGRVRVEYGRVGRFTLYSVSAAGGDANGQC